MNEQPSLEQLRMERDFINNWLSDLLAAMEDQLDEDTRVKLIEACGRGCYWRHDFKQKLSEQGRGSLERLLEAMSQNFEIWQEGNLVHIRYGEKSAGCYCPVLRGRPTRPDDPHCNCTKATHQTIFEQALGRPVQVEIVETVRRGGQTCHFIVHLD